MAEKSGFDITYFSKLETGVRPPPSAKTIVELASVLDADIDELLGTTKKIPSNLMEEWLKRLEKVMLQQSPDKPYKTTEMAGGSLAVWFIDGILQVK